jgi:hypothetical protein
MSILAEGWAGEQVLAIPCYTHHKALLLIPSVQTPEGRPHCSPGSINLSAAWEEPFVYVESTPIVPLLTGH